MVNCPVYSWRMHGGSIKIFGAGRKLAAYVVISCKCCEKTTAPIVCKSVFPSWQRAGQQLPLSCQWCNNPDYNVG